MQTALHLRALVRQIAHDMVGGTIVASEFYKKLRTACLIVKHEKTRVALVISYHPVAYGTYLVPVSKLQLATREKPWPFFQLAGAVVASVEQIEQDRIFRIAVEADSVSRSVIYEATGPNGNLWHLDEYGGRLASLRKRTFQVGEPYSATQMPGEKFDPGLVEADQLMELFGQKRRGRTLATWIKSNLSGFNQTLTQEVLIRAELDARADTLTGVQAEALARQIVRTTNAFDQWDRGYLYEINDGPEVYPFRLVSRDVQPEKFKTLSLAVMSMAARRRSTAREEDENRSVTRAVARAVKKLQRRLTAIERDLESAEHFERHRRYGELLQIHHDRLRKGIEEIELDDIIEGDGKRVRIVLDPALSPAENIESYFRKYRKGKEGLELLRRRKQITTRELSAWQEIQESLERNFGAAVQQYHAEIDAVRPVDRERRQETARLPYRTFTLASGLTVFVGRDGADNERTTFGYAKPYELWFHTQQCPGSHVVLKVPSRTFEPSRQEIEETASIAAWFSKARHDSLVPVIYTQRKFVRKPRKAKPGLVRVEREKSIMVQPQKPT